MQRGTQVKQWCALTLMNVKCHLPEVDYHGHTYALLGYFLEVLIAATLRPYLL